jgi:hypothetical protein
MADTITISWEDYLDRKRSIKVNQVVDARSFEGMAGYPWIIMAANPHLSNREMELALSECGGDDMERSESWIQRRRWMFRRSVDIARNGATPNRDGNYARALQIMRGHPTVSNCKLVHILKEHRIKRSREWVRKHRCDPLD